MIDHELIRQSYPQPSGMTYLNTSSSGLVSKSGINRAHEFNKCLLERSSAYVEEFYVNEIVRIREIVSAFVDASIDEIALIPNFSHGLNAVIPSISELKNVLLYRNDYPSLTLPFELNDFNITWLEDSNGFSIDLNKIESLVVEHKIEVLAFSHVQYLTGYTIELEKLHYICQKYRVLLILDATQSLGAFPFSFKSSGVNILITSNYKWMNAGYGTGILCIDRETMEKYPPKMGGFNSYKYAKKSWRYDPGISSYEPGHFNMAGLAMLAEAIEYKMQLGTDNIASHNSQLLQFFIEEIRTKNVEVIGPLEPQHRKNIIGIRGNQSFERHLLDRNVIVKMRENIIRIGVHFYNTSKDIVQLIEGIESFRNT